MPNNVVTSVLVIDDHDVVRRGLISYFDGISDFKIVGQASHGSDALDLYKKLNPDIVLVDIVMPDIDGIMVTRHLCEYDPNAVVVALSSYIDEEKIRGIINAGAIGYLVKTISSDTLLQTLRDVVRGGIAFSDEIQTLLKANQKSNTSSNTDIHLTERELEILNLVTEGLNNREIGEQLYVSTSTVKFHIQSIFSKLNVNNRIELVTLAFRYGIVS